MCEVKNKFSVNCELDLLEPNKKPSIFKVEKMTDKDNNIIESAPHPTMIVKIPYEREVALGSLLRMKSE